MLHAPDGRADGYKGGAGPQQNRSRTEDFQTVFDAEKRIDAEHGHAGVENRRGPHFRRQRQVQGQEPDKEGVQDQLDPGNQADVVKGAAGLSCTSRTGCQYQAAVKVPGSLQTEFCFICSSYRAGNVTAKQNKSYIVDVRLNLKEKMMKDKRNLKKSTMKKMI